VANEVRPRLNGWQRLWVLVSALYLVLVGGLAYATWPTFETTWHRQEFIDQMPGEVRTHLNGAYASKYEADREAKELSTKSPRIVYDGRQKILPNGAVLLVTGGEFKEFDVVMAYSAVVDAEVKAERWKRVGFVALLGIAPCLALYAFGWAIAWVYRGFRSGGPSAGV